MERCQIPLKYMFSQISSHEFMARVTLPLSRNTAVWRTNMQYVFLLRFSIYMFDESQLSNTFSTSLDAN